MTRKSAKKPAMRVLRKGQRCGKGWTALEIKVGKTVHRACVRGTVRTPRTAFGKAADWMMILDLPLTVISHLGH